MKENQPSRAHFGSKFGVVMAAVGSAVGLGNIWRFPYELGMNGGFAFLLVYLLCVLALGIPVMLAELVIGRRSRSNVFGSFKVLSPNGKWHYLGVVYVVAAFIISSFYFVVAGWSLEYVYQAVTDQFSNRSPLELSQAFTDFSTDALRPIFWTIVFVFLAAGVILAGVRKGIENISKVLMPMLFVIIVVLCVRSVTLPNATEGLKFLFYPDFSKINSSVVLSALGQAFFSLSIGMGCLITYGSYIDKKNNLLGTSVEVSVLDTLVSVLASVAIFPAVFSLGINPAKGPELVFITLPNVFMQIPGGYVWSVLFFLLLALAALTSIISLLEVITAYVSEEFKIKRRTAVFMASALLMFSATLCSLSLGEGSVLQLFGMPIFTLFDYVSAKIFMPLGGLFIAVFLGWFCSRKMVFDELTNGGSLKTKAYDLFYFLLRYFVPIAILMVFINELS
jgi:NSS family neurotransmitter:Na+ symporter